MSLRLLSVVGLRDVCNAAIESFDHAIGSRRSGLGQPVLYAQLLAQLELPRCPRRLFGLSQTATSAP